MHKLKQHQEGTFEEASHQMPGTWSPAPLLGTQPFLKLQQLSSTRQHPRQHYSPTTSTPCQRRELSPSLKLWVPPKRRLNINKLATEERQGAHICHSNPRNQLWKEQRYVKRCQENPASKLAVPPREMSATGSKTWKPHHLPFQRHHEGI